MVVHIGGDGTYLALVDTARYVGFVNGGDWSGRLLDHLVEQARSLAILPWATGFETDWRVEVRAGITGRQGFREFEATIRSTTGALHLVNHDSLTMAAQFADHTLPDEEARALVLAPGLHRVRVVQLVDPGSRWWEDGGKARPQFLLEHELTGTARGLPSVPWVPGARAIAPRG